MKLFSSTLEIRYLPVLLFKMFRVKCISKETCVDIHNSIRFYVNFKYISSLHAHALYMKKDADMMTLQALQRQRYQIR